MGTSPYHMFFTASKTTHSRHRAFFLRTRELNEHHTPNASQSTENAASPENTALLHYKVHINKHLKAVYEVFNYTLNVILLSARREAQQCPTCCAYTGAPRVTAVLLPEEKLLPNAVVITAPPHENNFCFPVTTWAAGPAGYMGLAQGSVLSLIICSEQWRVFISVVLLPTAFSRENYTQESPSELPTIHQRGYSFKAIAWSLFLFLWSGNFTLGKWEREQLPGTSLTLSVPPGAIEHITPPHFGPCHDTVPKISHSGCKQRWPPYTHTPAYCALTNTVLPALTFANRS